MKKLFVVVLLMAGAIAAGVLFVQRGKANGKNTTSDQAVVPVERGLIVASVSATGRVVANLDVQIKCKASGEVLALSFSVVVGVFFGYCPARRAAMLDPIEALRYE